MPRMPQRWTIREPGREWHIYRRFDAPATRLASKDDVIARWPRWVSDPASRRVLADLYRELVGPNLGQPDLGETLRVRERIEHAFRSQELVAVCIVSAIEVGGRPAPARETQPAPPPPPPTERGPKYEIEFRTPHDGDIFLVGDKVKVQAVVLENGAETDRPVSYSASRGSVRNSWVLLDVSGSHEIVAENSEVSVRDSIRITAVLPWVSRVESTGPELYKPYDHKSKSRKPGLIEWVLGQKRSTTLVPTVTKMGQEVRLTLSVRGSAPLPLSRKTEVEMFFGSVGSMDDTETEYASKPFGNQPIRWRGTGTLQGLNAEERVTLAADRPFPNRIVRFRWLKRWRYRVKWPDGAWSHPGEDPDPWRPLEGPPEFFAYTVWKAPILSGLSSLKETEYDHFHIDKACLFAEGAFHLKLCGAWSIPFKVDNRMGHYRWSDSLEDPEHEYRFFGGADPPKPQFKPANSAELRTHPDSLHYPDMESAAMKEFNLGWNLLDNRKGAGGRCNQQATLIAAILNTLGIRAQMRHFRSRGRWSGGLIDAGKNRHDPVTLRAPCFDDKHGSPTCDYGWNFHGI